jgi:hypothetical protein
VTRSAREWLAAIAFGFLAGSMVAVVVWLMPHDCSRRHTPRIDIGGVMIVAGCYHR